MTPAQLKQRRDDIGYTQVQMAAALKLPNVGTLRNWEQGIAKIPPFLDLAIEMIELKLRRMAGQIEIIVK